MNMKALLLTGLLALFLPWTASAPMRVVGVSLTAAGSTKIGTTIAGMTYHPTLVILNTRALSGTVVTPAVVSVGTNAPAYDNIMSSTTVGSTLLGALGKGYQSPVTGAYGVIPAGTDIFLRVSTAAVGPTAFTCDASVTGFYVEP